MILASYHRIMNNPLEEWLAMRGNAHINDNHIDICDRNKVFSKLEVCLDILWKLPLRPWMRRVYSKQHNKHSLVCKQIISCVNVYEKYVIGNNSKVIWACAFQPGIKVKLNYISFLIKAFLSQRQFQLVIQKQKGNANLMSHKMNIFTYAFWQEESA